MIISEKNLEDYLGNDLGSLESKVRRKVMGKIMEYSEGKNKELKDDGISVIDYLFLRHQKMNESLENLAEEMGISRPTLTKVFDFYNLPRLTNAEAVRRELYERWQDPKFRKRNAEAVRNARFNPENLSLYKLPTIQGYRKDIGFEAQSSWEANLARIFQYLETEYYPHEKFDLNVSDKYGGLFDSDKTSVQIDFLVRNQRGKLILYEIMASHLEGEKDLAKLEMLVEQYPLPLRIITPKKYHRLERLFKEKIQNSEEFFGWEDSKDNLITNPEKYKKR